MSTVSFEKEPVVRKPICVICNGEFPFASENAWGIRPDRVGHPNIFICWECVHWLFKVFLDHITNFSYSFLFVDKPIKIGKYSNRVIRNEQIVGHQRFWINPFNVSLRLLEEVSG